MTELIAERIHTVLSGDETSNMHGIRALIREALALKRPQTEIAALRLTLLKLECDTDWVIDLHCDGESVPHLNTGTDLWPEFEQLARLLGSRGYLLSWNSGCNHFDEACSRTWSNCAHSSRINSRFRWRAVRRPSNCAASRMSLTRSRKATAMPL